jgi:ATP-dependent exoDNAse (exonuclease V) beta subunit
MAPGRGSLAEVLPDSLRQLFGHAAASFADCVTAGWTSAAGRQFTWRICRVEGSQSLVTGVSTDEQKSRAADRLDPVDDVSRRLAVTGLRDDDTGSEPRATANDEALLTGILIHRLFQTGAVLKGLAPDVLHGRARALLRADESAGIDQLERLIAAAVSAWTRASHRADVRSLLEGERIWYEVPFSMATTAAGAAVILRGSIDLLVQRDDGTFVVVDFKTGRPRSSHQRQLDLYIQAVSGLNPGHAVEGRLVYVD